MDMTRGQCFTIWLPGCVLGFKSNQTHTHIHTHTRHELKTVSGLELLTHLIDMSPAPNAPIDCSITVIFI